MIQKENSKIIVILSFIILGLSSIFLFFMFNKISFIHNKNSQDISENQSEELQDKILLELMHEVAWDRLSETGAETKEETVNIVDEKLNKFIQEKNSKESIEKQYTNEAELSVLQDFIYKKFNLKLDNKWKYRIKIWNADDNCGMISFIYCIDENIETNRAIHFVYDNGTINELVYSYIDNEIDEDSIKNKVKLFTENTIQEKEVLEGNETYVEERTHFVYNYRINKTTYSYALFIAKNHGTITDSWCDYVVDDFLKEHNLF